MTGSNRTGKSAAVSEKAESEMVLFPQFGLNQRTTFFFFVTIRMGFFFFAAKVGQSLCGSGPESFFQSVGVVVTLVLHLFGYEHTGIIHQNPTF